LEQLHEMRSSGASMAEIYEARRAAAPELAGNIYYRAYQTADSYLVVGCLGPGPRARFREALQIRDPRYEEGFDQTRLREVGAQLVAECEGKFRLRTNAEWLQHLHANDVAAGPYRFVDELWDDPQIAANGYMTEYEHTLLGQLRGPAPIVKMDATPTRVQRASPALGEHTDEVLGELGFTDEAIALLRASGAVD
jgi:formyl-CoA transferase